MNTELKQAAQRAIEMLTASSTFFSTRSALMTDECRAAAEALRTAIQQAESEPVAWPLRAQVWKRESTQEWVLEIAGTLGDTDMNIRHTQPLSVAYENVPGLPTFYTHPAPGVPADVVLDAERYRWLRENGTLGFSGAPSWRASVSFDAVDAYAQTLDSNIDAAQAQKGQP